MLDRGSSIMSADILTRDGKIRSGPGDFLVLIFLMILFISALLAKGILNASI